MPSPDELFMRRALTLAAHGRGLVEPNPLVGCVITKNNQIIAEGYHHKFGSPHAEAEALANCTESANGATAYVTLEPCCHTNKKTPPCVPRLIEAQISQVKISCLDPNPHVAGNGVAELRAAGIDVSVGLLEPEAKQLNAPFFALIRHHRPYVTLKWAQTVDGKVAAPPGSPRLLITSQVSNRLVHHLRARCDAILVGINTVLADDPLLTVRHIPPLRPLTRIVLDRDLRTPLTSQLVQTALHTPTIIFSHHPNPTRSAELKLLGVEVIDTPTHQGALSLPDILTTLAQRNVTHLLVEPGPRLAQSFLESNLADRLWIFHSPHQSTDPNALNAIKIDYPHVGEANIDGDHLVESLNSASEVFFSPEPSPDFHLASGS